MRPVYSNPKNLASIFLCQLAPAFLSLLILVLRLASEPDKDKLSLCLEHHEIQIQFVFA